MVSTYPLGPFFASPAERAILARLTRQARRSLLVGNRAVRFETWSRGYHVRCELGSLLTRAGERDLAARIWQCPVWRGRIVTGFEARELATDGPLNAPGVSRLLQAITRGGPDAE